MVKHTATTFIISFRVYSGRHAALTLLSIVAISIPTLMVKDLISLLHQGASQLPAELELSLKRSIQNYHTLDRRWGARKMHNSYRGIDKFAGTITHTTG